MVRLLFRELVNFLINMRNNSQRHHERRGHIQRKADLRIIVAVFAYCFSESLERKYWLPIATVLTFVGGLIIALAGSGNFAIAAIGSIVLFFGFNLFVPMSWAWSAENYPTWARTSGFALVDGIGHLGGGIGILVLAPFIPTMGPVVTFLAFGGFLVVSSVVAQFGISTRNKRLDEVSP